MPDLGAVEDRAQDSTRRRHALDHLDLGLNTRSFPHVIDERELFVADNVCFTRDALVSKRPGNKLYGTVVANQPVQSMTRFYPVTGSPQLIAQASGSLYAGNDTTGVFTLLGSGFSATKRARFAQVYDPDMSTGAARALVIVDGVRVPAVYDGTNLVAVHTGTGSQTIGGFTSAFDWLPNSATTGNPITPAYVCNWKYHLVYAGEPTDPSALWISDALEPERFNGLAMVTSAATPYTAYYPAGRDGVCGDITGVCVLGPYLVVFYTSGIAVGINTGTYGATNFEWNIISTKTGCCAPDSIALYGGFAIFFGGDQFYATDAQSIVPLPNKVPSIYSGTSGSSFPPDMKNKATVFGVRRGLQYWASYDNTGAGPLSCIAVFDLGAAGGWSYGSPTGGAWSRWPTGMQLNTAIECRGKGDESFPMYWGDSLTGNVYQHDVGTYDDNGMGIAIEIRLKALFFGRMNSAKQLFSITVVGAFPNPFGAQSQAYFDAVQAYCINDNDQLNAPIVDLQVPTPGALYDGSINYDGQHNYGGGSGTLTSEARAYPMRGTGYVLQPGLIESSTNPFNLIGLVLDYMMDPP